jgi:hypothetical protein
MKQEFEFNCLRFINLACLHCHYRYKYLNENDWKNILDNPALNGTNFLY